MRNKPVIMFHLKLVAKVALAAGGTAVTGLVVALTFLTNPTGEAYHDMIRSSSITRESIGPLMLLAGLTLVAVVGVLTWLIALYSSFRIAGPLYRFSRNFKLAIADRSADLIALRTGDALRRQERNIRHAIDTLRAHSAAIEETSRQAAAALERRDAEAYADAVARLKALDEKARL